MRIVWFDRGVNSKKIKMGLGFGAPLSVYVLRSTQILLQLMRLANYIPVYVLRWMVIDRSYTPDVGSQNTGRLGHYLTTADWQLTTY